MSEERTLKIVSETILGLVNRRGCWFLQSIANINSFIEAIYSQIEPKRRIIFSMLDVNNNGLFLQEGVDWKLQFRRGINRTFDFIKTITIGNTK